MTKQPSLIGGAAIVASVCVGAGMLGLPSSGAGAWTGWTLFALCLTMVVMTLSGALLLEAFQHFDQHISFSTATQELLGRFYNILNNLSVYFVGGILLYAYTTTLGGLGKDFLGLNPTVAAVLGVLLFSFPVWLSTRSVDRLSIVLIVFMFTTFIFAISGLAGQINLHTLFNTGASDTRYFPYIMVLLPVALTSFGYHHSVASMRIYYGCEKKAFWAIAGGTTIALIFYILWVVSIFGNLPRTDFIPIVQQQGDVHVLINALSKVIDSQSVNNLIRAFSLAAIISSFVGVGLGVFDYLADLFHIKTVNPKNRAIVWAITFLPPLLASIFYPLGFLYSIAYAGAVATVWTCLTPALLAWRARTRFGVGSFRLPLAYISMIVVFCFGILVAVFHFMSMFHLLPVYGA